MTNKEGAAARGGSRRQLGRLASGLGGEMRACRLRPNSPVLVETSGLAAAIGGSPAPAIANLGPLWSQLSSLACPGGFDAPQATLPLMPSPAPFLTPGGQTTNKASSKSAGWPLLLGGYESLPVDGLLGLSTPSRAP
jgi:hypothetical protein